MPLVFERHFYRLGDFKENYGNSAFAAQFSFLRDATSLSLAVSYGNFKCRSCGKTVKGICRAAFKRLNYALGKHRVGDFYKAGDVCAFDIIDITVSV